MFVLRLRIPGDPGASDCDPALSSNDPPFVGSFCLFGHRKHGVRLVPGSYLKCISLSETATNSKQIRTGANPR